MWGTHTACHPLHGHARFIPAYVGNTLKPWLKSRVATVHPRVCGEHLHRLLVFPESRGSSPRMWGTPETIEADVSEPWFIPAYVGNTASRQPGPSGPTVHPRVCGEHFLRSRMILSQPRFIPAYVGNTMVCRLPPIMAAVHPRVCGEHQTLAAVTLPATGSSPRMWGTPGRHRPRYSARRFIPAYVGNTSKPFGTGPGRTVHPRVCGEHIYYNSTDAYICGSSPRMWGTLLVLQHLPKSHRFIPAYVGNTPPSVLAISP